MVMVIIVEGEILCLFTIHQGDDARGKKGTYLGC